MIDILALKRSCLPMGNRLYINSSKSSSPVSTANVDGRVVGGDDSLNQSISIAGSGNALTTTDFGAVGKSIDLAKAGVESANKVAGEALVASGHVFEGAFNLVGKQQEKFTQALEDIKGNDVRVLVIAGLAVVGIAATKFLKA